MFKLNQIYSYFYSNSYTYNIKDVKDYKVLGKLSLNFTFSLGKILFKH